MNNQEIQAGVRFSSYSILSERLPGGGYALLNGVSGALDLISDDIGEAIKRCYTHAGGPARLDPAAAEAAIGLLESDDRASLYERGHLTELEREVERHLAAEVAEAIHEVQRHDPQFMVVPNLDCNYRCTYCFERPLQKGLKNPAAEISHHHKNVVMSPERVAMVYRAIDEIRAREGRTEGKVVVLYGGEPLDARNRDVVFEIVRQGVDRGFRFAAITNGHDLPVFFPVIGRGKIEQVQISIDGPKGVHDRRRIHIGGESSFDRLIANLRAALAATDAEYQLRVHVDPDNIHLFEQTLAVFGAEGWLDHPQVVVYANTVYAKDAGGSVGARLDNSAIHEQLRAIAARHRNVYTSAPAVHANRALEAMLSSGGRFQSKGTYCAANSGNYIFAPDGHVYACWESLGKPCSRVGQYAGDNGLVLDEAATARWFGRTIAKIPACLECAYALVCGGGCAQFAEYNFGTAFKPYCDDFQHVFGRALADALESHIAQAVFTPNQKEDVPCQSRQCV